LPAWRSRWCCTRTASTLTESAKADEGEEEARRRKEPTGEVARISSDFVLDTLGRYQELAKVRGSKTSAGASMFLIMLMLVFWTVGMSKLEIWLLRALVAESLWLLRREYLGLQQRRASIPESLSIITLLVFTF